MATAWIYSSPHWSWGLAGHPPLTQGCIFKVNLSCRWLFSGPNMTGNVRSFATILDISGVLFFKVRRHLPVILVTPSPVTIGNLV